LGHAKNGLLQCYLKRFAAVAIYQFGNPLFWLIDAYLFLPDKTDEIFIVSHHVLLYINYLQLLLYKIKAFLKRITFLIG